MFNDYILGIAQFLAMGYAGSILAEHPEISITLIAYIFVGLIFDW